MSVLSVSNSLRSVSATPEIVNAISVHKDSWVSFGRKNSHILRTMLFKLFRENNMSKEAIFWVYFFHSLVKDKDRILMAIDLLDDSIKGMDSVQEAAKFIRTKMVKFVRDETSSRFASVHLPTTNPGLDILCFLMSLGKFEKADVNDRVLEEFYNLLVSRNTAAQIDLHPDVQAVNKEHVKVFWDSTIMLNDAEERKKNKQPVGFQEKFYETSAHDNYRFITKDFKEAGNAQGGYTKEMVKEYISKVITLDEKSSAPAPSPSF